MPDIFNPQPIGDNLAMQLVTFGFDVVLVDEAFVGQTGTPADLQDFIILHGIARGTTFVWTPAGRFAQLTRQRPDEFSHYWVEKIGALFFHAAKVGVSETHGLIVGKLSALEPVILVRQTANALDLAADDIRKLPLTRLDRILLAGVVGWVRRTGFPVIVALAPPDRALRRRLWPLSIRWKPAHRRFVRINPSGLRWADAK